MQETNLVRTMAALSYKTRFDIFLMLANHNPAGLSPTVIARQLGISPSSASYHLFKLLRANLIRRIKRNGRPEYSADASTAREFLKSIGELAKQTTQV